MTPFLCPDSRWRVAQQHSRSVLSGSSPYTLFSEHLLRAAGAGRGNTEEEGHRDPRPQSSRLCTETRAGRAVGSRVRGTWPTAQPAVWGQDLDGKWGTAHLGAPGPLPMWGGVSGAALTRRAGGQLAPLLSAPFLGFRWVSALPVPRHGFNRPVAFVFSSPGYTEPLWAWAPSWRGSWENPPWSP